MTSIKLSSKESKPKECIWSYSSDMVVVLVPKKKGSGYLKSPVWHNGSELVDIVRDLHFGDIKLDATGLDGYLSIRSGTSSPCFSSKSPDTILNQIIAPLCDKFGWTSKHAQWNDFFDLVLENLRA